jgi:alpha-glucoside transport system permease protein
VTDTVDDAPEVEAPGDEGLDLAVDTRRDPGEVALRVAATIAVPAVAFAVMIWAFGFLRTSDANRVVIALVAIAVGVAGVFAVFWGMDRAVYFLPERWRESVRPYVFIGPALVLISVFLIYPVVNTVLLSVRDSRGQAWVGIENYRFVFTDPGMLRSIRNTALWIIVVPAVAVSIGLVFATLADRLRRLESLAKSLIFLPMAISFVAAFVTWRLIYGYRPAGFGSNVGLLNGIMEAFGQDPVSWLAMRPWNNLLLMVIMIWMQTGFAMVVLSAAIKAIPDEIIEAARIDGASELQVFWKITIPSIMPSIVVVTTYMVVNAMKVFDIVFVMGSPEANHTEVIAYQMIRYFFVGNHDGRAAAIAVVLFLAIIPVMAFNVRRFREQESQR